MGRWGRGGLLLVLGVAACRKPPAQSGTCAQLADPGVRNFASAEIPENPPSVLTVTAALELARLRKEIEAKVPKRVAEESNRDIGSAGKLSYTIDRGPFAFSLVNDKLIVHTDLVIEAKVCKPLGPLGCTVYATCHPTARADAVVSTKLGPKYSFSPSTVSIEFTKRCLMTALDIDVTPQMQAQASAETKKIKARIDGQLPSFEAHASKAWTRLHTQVPLGTSSCASLKPNGVAQGPSKLEGDTLLLRFGVRATPSVESPCPKPIEPGKLPDLAQDATLPESFALHLPVRVAVSGVDTAWSKQLDGTREPVTTGLVTTHGIKGGAAIDVGVSGPICGVVTMQGEPSWDEQKGRVVLSVLGPWAGEEQRAAPIDLRALAATMRNKLALELPVSGASVAKELEGLPIVLREEVEGLTVVVSKQASTGTFVSATELETRFLIEGKAAVKVK